MGTMAEAFEQEKKRQASAENRRFTEGALKNKIRFLHLCQKWLELYLLALPLVVER